MPSLDTFEDFEAIPSSMDELSNSSDMEEETNPNNVIPFSKCPFPLQLSPFLLSKDWDSSCKDLAHICLKSMGRQEM